MITSMMPTESSPSQHQNVQYSTYPSKKYPASEKHLTFVVDGNRSWNLSQCSIAARPPAEHPERRTCNMYDAIAQFSRSNKHCSGSKQTLIRMKIVSGNSCIRSIYVTSIGMNCSICSIADHYDANFGYFHRTYNPTLVDRKWSGTHKKMLFFFLNATEC